MGAETIATVISSISTVGFPIVMCLIMVWLNKTQSEKHDCEMKEVTKAIENNTLVMMQIAEKISN